MPLPTGSRDKDSYLSFVKNGFNCWKKGIERLGSHEKSQYHRAAIETLRASQATAVSSLLSDQAKKEMIEARSALSKIFSSIRYLGCQGIAIRGKTEDSSNFKQLLLERATDDPSLAKWLNRPEKYKWISPEISNEILLDFSLAIQRVLSERVRKADSYGVMVDESADESAKEQVKSIENHMPHGRVIT